jgi:ABC-type transport system involved in multi-copper enzyme maturation permease subunit
LEVIRRKDVYVLLILMGSLLAALASLNVLGLGGVVVYVMHIGLFMAWLFSWILAVNVSARELPQEESRGTIFPLLAKPITRQELVLGKWIGAWSVVTSATFFFYALVIAVVLVRGGYAQPVALGQGFVLHSVAIGITAAVAVALSTRMNHDAAASTAYVLTAAAFLIVPRIPSFLANEIGMRASMLMLLYNILPHFEVFDMRRRISFDYGPTDWKTFFLIIAYGLALIVFLLTLAWLAYRRKHFVRGALANL